MTISSRTENPKARTSTLNRGLFLTCERVTGELDLTWSYMERILFEDNRFKRSSVPEHDNVFTHCIQNNVMPRQ